MTALCALPSTWLLASGDGDGALSLCDVRMLGAASRSPMLWSVRGAHGAVRSITAVTPPSTRAGTVVATASHDGAIRLWRASDGVLVQVGPPAVRVCCCCCCQAKSRRDRGSGGGKCRMLVTAPCTSPGWVPQAVEGAHMQGGRRLSSGARGLLERAIMPRGGLTAAPVTGLGVCSEGLVSCGHDGAVRLFPFLMQ